MQYKYQYQEITTESILFTDFKKKISPIVPSMSFITKWSFFPGLESSPESRVVSDCHSSFILLLIFYFWRKLARDV